MRVDISPGLIKWARGRVGRTIKDLSAKFPKLEEWEAGVERPTLKQLENYAKTTRTPFGYFFLDEPPEEKIPIPDFRTIASRRIARPSPDLLETIYICQQRQDWYRDFATSINAKPLSFVGSISRKVNFKLGAKEISNTIQFDLNTRRKMKSWEDALRSFIHLVEDAGILVMANGIVGSNSHRPLDPDEFRGFTLVDPIAPLIFLNGKDTKSAQMFTLAHELAHTWLGETALTDATPSTFTNHDIESWCNQVAAEILVPENIIADEYSPDENIFEEMNRLAEFFKVSTLVILRRIHDIGGIRRDTFNEVYEKQLSILKEKIRSGSKGGGDFYRTLKRRIGDRFARAMVISTLEGRTPFTDAFQMLSIKKMATFHDLASKLGVPT